MQTVDKRSAVMSDKNFLIGCEEAVPVNATHASLPRFGDISSSAEFTNYINALNNLVECADVEQSPENEEKARLMIESDVRAEVHPFYDTDRSRDAKTVRLWSVDPSLHELFEKGSDSILLKRSEEAKLLMENPADVIGDDKLPMVKPPLAISVQGLGAGTRSGGAGTSTDADRGIGEANFTEPSSPTKYFPGSLDDSRSGYHIPKPANIFSVGSTFLQTT